MQASGEVVATGYWCRAEDVFTEEDEYGVTNPTSCANCGNTDIEPVHIVRRVVGLGVGG